ncbi:MAG: hypothetical protein J7M11_01500 [Elusimicrobia bacterium]|nr:hypothetical protein [Elusimicrobiota bacterium]
MKNRAAFFFAVLLTLASAAGSASAGFFYEKEPFAAWGFSPGHQIGTKLYFICNYALRRRAKGIAAFPDGGIPKTVFARTYFCSFDKLKKKLDILAKLGDKRLPGGIQGGVVHPDTKFSLEEGVLYMAYRIKVHPNTGADTYGMFSWDIEKRLLVKIPPERQESFFKEHFADSEKIKSPKPLAHYKTYRLVKEIPLEEWGLPTVLDYCKKSNKAYAKDLILLRGGQTYRRLVIDKLGKVMTADEIKSILTKMEKRKNKLKSYQRLKYELNGKETREALEALLKN